jgi:hypothetical protein
LEVLIGIPVLLATVNLIDAIGVTRRRNTIVVTIMCGLAIVIQRWSVYPDWGHIPFGPKVFSIEAPHLPPHSLVVVAGLAQANSYILPFIKGDDVSFVGITHTTIEARDFRLWKETAERIHHHSGSIFVLERFDIPYFSAYTTSVLQGLHVTVNSGQCNPVRSNLDQDITLCSASITE